MYHDVLRASLRSDTLEYKIKERPLSNLDGSILQYAWDYGQSLMEAKLTCQTINIDVSCTSSASNWLYLPELRLVWRHSDFQIWLTTRSVHLSLLNIWWQTMLFTFTRSSMITKNDFVPLVATADQTYTVVCLCRLKCVSCWSGVKPIVLVADHNLHGERFLIRPNEKLCLWHTAYPLIFSSFFHFIFAWRRLSSCCRWILGWFCCKSSFKSLSIATYPKYSALLLSSSSFYVDFASPFLYGFNNSPGMNWKVSF